jgi:hypothetical protein
MAEPVDALADRLGHLMREGRLPSSGLSRSMRGRLRTLFETGAIVEERSGAGGRIVVRDAAAIERFVAREYPSGITPIVPEGMPPRARSVFLKGNAKRAARGSASAIVLRAFTTARLERDEDSLDVFELTRVAGAAALVVGPGCSWRFNGVVALVENLEVFLHAERIVAGFSLVLYAPGRLSQIVRDWLASPAMMGARYLHLGDYDPVGLDEYLKLKIACPGRVELHVPPDFEERLKRFGKEALLSDSAAVLARLRRAPDPEVSAIVGALDRHGRGLEQEALLLPFRDTR